MRRAVLFLFAISVSLSTIGNLFAGNVSGTFKASKKGTIQPVEVAAFPVRSRENPLKKVTAVVLSEGKMDAVEAVQSLDPHTALINQQGMQDKNYITFILGSGGFVTMNATFHEGMVQYIDSTKDPEGESILAQSLEANFSANSADRVAARIRTSKVVESAGGDTYELDVEFDVPVTKAPSAKALDASGGEAGKVMLTLLDAIKSKNWPALQKSVSSEILQEVTDPDATNEKNVEYVVDRVNLLLPKGKAKVIGGEEMAERAFLVLQGEMQEGGVEAYYVVQMVKEPEGWRFDRSTVAGFV
jgi:hypothetical protein